MAGTLRRYAPYALPYLGFLALVEMGRLLPPAFAPAWLAVKVVVPAALLGLYARRGAYPELRGFRWDRGALLDGAVGLAIAALWLGLFLLAPSLRAGEAFAPGDYAPIPGAAALAIRAIGFAGVTPFVEELFVRSFLLREVDVLVAGEGDFRDEPIGRFRWASFLATTAWFTFSHVPWEWIVAAPTGALLTLWLYRRRHIGATILAHAVANGSIALVVALGPWELWDFL